MFDFSAWVENFVPFLHDPVGVVLFIPFYALWVTFLLPGVWASMLAGVLYGTWFGSCLVFFGACLGAELVFLMGRTFLREWARKRLSKYPKLQVIVKTVSSEGLRLVFLTRLSPAFPFSFLNLAYGLSEVSWRDYTIGLIGILPGTIFFCGLGAFAGDLTQFSEVFSGQRDLNSYLLKLLGLLATFAVIWLVVKSTKTALQDLDSSS